MNYQQMIEQQEKVIKELQKQARVINLQLEQEINYLQQLRQKVKDNQ